MKDFYLLLLLFQTSLAVAVQFTLKKLASDTVFSIWPPQQFFSGITKLLSTPLFWVAMVLYGVSLMMWLSILSRFSFVLAIPLAVGINFAMVYAVSALFLHERVTFWWFVGVALILSGVLLLALLARGR
ncbi:MAG: hypothetical protein Q8R11_02385 [bacterium]|nr:hypothetical protein [bacterium]